MSRYWDANGLSEGDIHVSGHDCTLQPAPSTMAALVAVATSVAMYGYPTYASYKVLATRAQRPTLARAPTSGWRGRRTSADALRQAPPPGQLAEAERWVMYWCIAACITMAENWVGWMWNWCVSTD